MQKVPNLIYLCHQQACYFNKFDFQVFFFTNSWEQLLLFYLPCCNRQCVLLLHAWWIFIEHTKEKKKETDSEIMNLKKKDHSILKINGVNTPILNWQLFSKLFINFFCSVNLIWTWLSILNRIPAKATASAGCYWKHCLMFD